MISQQHSYSMGRRCMWSIGINSARAASPEDFSLESQALSVGPAWNRPVPAFNVRERQRPGNATGNKRLLGFGNIGTFCGLET